MKRLCRKPPPRTLGCILLVLLLVGIDSLPYILSRDLRERYGSLSEVQEELEAHVPDGTVLQELQVYLESQSWECSEFVEDGVIRCSAPGPTPNFWSSRKWLLEFEITNGKLKNSTAREGFIGP